MLFLATSSIIKKGKNKHIQCSLYCCSAPAAEGNFLLILPDERRFVRGLTGEVKQKHRSANSGLFVMYKAYIFMK
ncbi:hypothetical protein C6Y45_14840 [Alkalicoccus saliphilus]|uniref:Uncharacterized protein n=1 Tax=Alkalicoccus saliphilus TaxID=200989 RepID=A0A2T4U2X1_9BACI|nr:hypothetical protein C6Y45_14840 [Alkalicoccus saliphilus]